MWFLSRDTCGLYYEYNILATRLRSTTVSLAESDDRNNKITDKDRIIRSVHHIDQATAQCAHIDKMIRLGKKDHEKSLYFNHSRFMHVFDFV